MPGKLILVRHGQSIWNVENLFTGWYDVDLSEQGRLEAAQAGRELLAEKLEPHHRRQLAPERTPLRRTAGFEQGADRCAARRGASETLAPQLRHSSSANANG
jgi:hypothetical protein